MSSWPCRHSFWMSTCPAVWRLIASEVLPTVEPILAGVKIDKAHEAELVQTQDHRTKSKTMKQTVTLIERRIRSSYWFPYLLVILIVDTSLSWLLTAPGTRVACLCIFT